MDVKLVMDGGKGKGKGKGKSKGKDKDKGKGKGKAHPITCHEGPESGVEV